MTAAYSADARSLYIHASILFLPVSVSYFSSPLPPPRPLPHSSSHSHCSRRDRLISFLFTLAVFDAPVSRPVSNNSRSLVKTSRKNHLSGGNDVYEYRRPRDYVLPEWSGKLLLDRTTWFFFIAFFFNDHFFIRVSCEM